MKVGLLNTLYYPMRYGGAERSVQLLAEGLKAAGVDVFVITTDKQTTVREVNGIKVYAVSLANLYWPFDPRTGSGFTKPIWHAIDTYNPRMAAKVGEILAQERPDILNTNNVSGFSTAVWKQAKALGIPVVHTLRDYHLLCIKSTMYRGESNCESLCIACRCYSAPKKALTTLVQHVQGISQAVLAAHTQRGYFPNAKTSVIHNIDGIDAASVRVERTPPFHRFGYMGRLEGAKGVEEMLTAFAAAHRKNPSLTLSLAGKGEDGFVTGLKEKFGHLPITLLGQVDPALLFEQIDFLIVPSRWHEPLGRVVLEAYAHGLPVIGARRGGIAEIVEAGRTGYTYEADDVSHLSATIEQASATSEQVYRLMASNIAAYRQRFSSTSIVAQYLDMYRSVLA